jgi:hypothetical protein
VIAFRIELRCDGCHKAAFHVSPIYMALGVAQVEQVIGQAISEGWVKDGTAHFCKKCQTQRKAG